MTEWAVKQTEMMNNALGAMFVSFPPSRTKRRNFSVRNFNMRNPGAFLWLSKTDGHTEEAEPEKNQQNKTDRERFYKCNWPHDGLEIHILT